MKKYLYSLLIIMVCVATITVVIVINKNSSTNNITPTSYGTTNKEPEEVSVISLLSTPEKYDGRFVRVIGVGCIKFEGYAFYLSKDDYKYNVTKNALWMDLDYKSLNTSDKELEKWNGKYVLVEGIFNSKKNGHLNLFSGTIENVTRYAYHEKNINK